MPDTWDPAVSSQWQIRWHREREARLRRLLEHLLSMSPLELWNASPFELMRRMSDEVDRMFQGWAGQGTGAGGGIWVPAVEVAEREASSWSRRSCRA